MKDKRHIIFERGECLPEDMLLRYVNDQLTAKEKHVVEKHTLGCELCADALEGLMLMKAPSQLNGIVESLNKRIGGAGEGRKPIVLSINTFMAIAAGLALLIGLFFIFNTGLKEASSDKTLSDNLKQKEEVTKSPVEKEESFKTESTPTSPDQSIATDKVISTLEANKADKSGELIVKSPQTKAISGGDDGDKLRSKDAIGGLTLTDAPPPQAEPLEQKQNLNTVVSDDRSKLSDRKVQSEHKQLAEKDVASRAASSEMAKSQDEEVEVSANEGIIPNENLEPTTTQMHGLVGKNASYLSKKSEAPKREEKEQVLAKAEKRKDKYKYAETAAPQKPNDGANFANGTGNAGYVSAPQPTNPTGTAGAAPGMAPQSNTAIQDISRLKGSADESSKITIDSKTKSDADSYRADVKKGKKRYGSKDYNQAVLFYSKALQAKPEDREALYYLGCSYLELNKPDLAIIQFDKLINSGAGLYYDGARYNKANALIKQNKNTEAKILLEKIIQTSAEYKKRATQTLDLIK